MPDVAASWTWPNRGVETAWISLEASPRVVPPLQRPFSNNANSPEWVLAVDFIVEARSWKHQYPHALKVEYRGS